MFKSLLLPTTLLLTCSILTGCSTMHFVNGPEMEEKTPRNHWHHLALFGSIEVSPPFALSYNCDDKEWNKITIEKTFLNGIASASIEGVNLYSPWTVRYSCRQPLH